jgi:hypothetical protein
VRYFRTARLLEELALASVDGSWPRFLDRLQKTWLLVLDDLGLVPPSEVERCDLLEVIEDRTGRQATLVTSKVPIEHWHEAVGDATFADAPRSPRPPLSPHPPQGRSMRRERTTTPKVATPETSRSPPLRRYAPVLSGQAATPWPLASEQPATSIGPGWPLRRRPQSTAPLGEVTKECGRACRGSNW